MAHFRLWYLWWIASNIQTHLNLHSPVWERSSPARGYKFGSLFLHRWSLPQCEDANLSVFDLCLCQFDLLKPGCANSGGFGARCNCHIRKMTPFTNKKKWVWTAVWVRPMGILRVVLAHLACFLPSSSFCPRGVPELHLQDQKPKTKAFFPRKPPMRFSPPFFGQSEGVHQEPSHRISYMSFWWRDVSLLGFLLLACLCAHLFLLHRAEPQHRQRIAPEQWHALVRTPTCQPPPSD